MCYSHIDILFRYRFCWCERVLTDAVLVGRRVHLEGAHPTASATVRVEVPGAGRGTTGRLPLFVDLMRTVTVKAIDNASIAEL